MWIGPGIMPDTGAHSRNARPTAKLRPRTRTLLDHIAMHGQNPLDMALARRDSRMLHTVREAIARGDVLLAFQPVVQAREPALAAFHEGPRWVWPSHTPQKAMRELTLLVATSLGLTGLHLLMASRQSLPPTD